MRSVRVRRGAGFGGTFRPPGDKSISHRAVLYAALAEGESELVGLNPGEDVGRTLALVARLGATVVRTADGHRVRGIAGRWRQPLDAALDCGNSGTTLRLAAGSLASAPVKVVLSGDASLRRRPMGRIIEPLRLMGARLAGADGDRTAPLTLEGGGLHGIDYTCPVASAQVSGAVLLAGLGADGATSVSLPGPARDHTERLLPAFGVPLETAVLAGGGRRTRLAGPAVPRSCGVRVAGDPSAAAFLFAAAAAMPGAVVRAEGVSVNPTRSGFLDVLHEMGAEVTRERERQEGGEPVADVVVRGPERLRAFDVPAEWAPRLIDEAPAWVVVASAAQGVSRLAGVGELRVKESDRIALLTANLQRLGVPCAAHTDGISVTGVEVAGGGGPVEAQLDHRIVMAFAALGARTAEPIRIEGADHAATSDPDFFATLAALGAEVEVLA